MTLKIGGIITPLITPFNKGLDGKFHIDGKATDLLISKQIDNGVGTIFIFGFAGACTKLLDLKERKIHLMHVLNLVQRKVPVIVGVSHEELTKSAELAKHAEEAGAEAIVLLLNHGSASYQDKVAAILKSTASIPLFLYNNPHIGLKRNLIVEDLVEMVSLYPGRILGLKESSGDENIFRSFIDFQKKKVQQQETFLLFMGEATKTGWAVSNQRELGFTLPGTVPVEANIAERIPNYARLLYTGDSTGIEFLSIPQVIQYLILQQRIDPATLDFWNT